jgi:tRNA (cmo5U34)-methyltransferase
MSKAKPNSAGTNGRSDEHDAADGQGARLTRIETEASALAAAAAAAEPDKVFAAPLSRVDDFTFNKEVANVFDDMVDRSVPFYQEIQRMVAELATDFAQPGTNVYDLGCSTCASFLQIDRVMPPEAGVRFVGIDDSTQMLDKARAKLAAVNFKRPFHLETADLNTGVEISNASVVMLVLTLQFIRPLYRERLIQSIWRGLGDNGCLIVVEKVLGENSTFNRLFIKHYYEMKRRNGYSELEISQKREALENVLVPYRLEENKELLRGAGFRHVDTFFKWYNFCGMIALK